MTGTGKQYLSLGIRDYGFDLSNRAAPATLEGVQIESSTSGGTASIAVKYTWMGDIDLDGKVTVNDYLEFLYYYNNKPATADITWMTGDFNYDGMINVNDYLLLLLSGYSHQGAARVGVDGLDDSLGYGQQLADGRLGAGPVEPGGL